MFTVGTKDNSEQAYLYWIHFVIRVNNECDKWLLTQNCLVLSILKMGWMGHSPCWECAMERRVTASDKVLGEFHAMVLDLRPTPKVLRPDPALASASTAFGSAAAAGMGPSFAGLTHPFAMPGPVSADPVALLSFGASDARATPWPNTDTVPGTAVFEALPGPAQAMIDSCSSASLPLDARIPDGLQAKIWRGLMMRLFVPSVTSGVGLGGPSTGSCG